MNRYAERVRTLAVEARALAIYTENPIIEAGLDDFADLALEVAAELEQQLAAHTTPIEGSNEPTDVKARECPDHEASAREATTGGVDVGRATGALLTGPTPQGGYRQTPRGESNGCRDVPISASADGNTIGALTPPRCSES